MLAVITNEKWAVEVREVEGIIDEISDKKAAYFLNQKDADEYIAKCNRMHELVKEIDQLAIQAKTHDMYNGVSYGQREQVERERQTFWNTLLEQNREKLVPIVEEIVKWHLINLTPGRQVAIVMDESGEFRLVCLKAGSYAYLTTGIMQREVIVATFGFDMATEMEDYMEDEEYIKDFVQDEVALAKVH